MESRPDQRLVLGGPFVMDVAAIACMAMVITTAALSYRFIEKPGTKLATMTPLTKN